MNMLDRIRAGVADYATAPTSTVRLLHNIAAQIHATAGNRDAANALSDLLYREAGHLAALVLANTPVIAATPPVHPLPGHHAGRDGGEEQHAA